MIESYAGLAALCLHGATTVDGPLASVSFDGLTGCLNHTMIRAELQREIGRSQRHGRPVSCFLIDLDHFKQGDDRRGNRALADVSAILREGVRAGDTIGHYGGDQLVAILADTDQSAACVLANRLRSIICTTTPDGEHAPLDASVGVAEWRPRQTADEMLAAADQALLAAKTAGGGIVVRADDGAAGAARDIAVGANGEIVPGTLPRARSLTACPAAVSTDAITSALTASPYT
ncbi:MAG: GGDEF domain-containing protein [Actinomycetota bacterium]|nr:GGDEF domain-containing protein [Actinomycetota bacterium]